MRTTFTVTLAGLLLVGFALPGRGEGDLFELARAVPDDVFQYTARRANPEGAFLQAYWDEVIQAAIASGVGKDLVGMLGAMGGGERMAALKGFQKQASDLWKAVDWKALMSDRVAFAQRMEGPKPVAGEMLTLAPNDMVLLCRVPKDTAELRYKELTALLRGAAAEVNKAAGAEMSFMVENSVLMGAKVARVDIFGGRRKGREIWLAVATRDDLVILSLGGTILDDVLALLAGKPGKKALADSARFQGAFAKLPVPKDTVSYLDAQKLLGAVDAILDVAFKSANPGPGGPGGQANPAAAAQKVVAHVLDSAAMMDYVASVTYTDGHSVWNEGATVLTADAKTKALYKVFSSRKPLTNYEKYLPKETMSFSVSQGADLKAVYGFIHDLFKIAGPQGEALWAQWTAFQKRSNVDLDKDVFRWLEGTTVSVTLQDGASVSLVKVLDEQAARESVSAGIRWVSNFIAQQAASNPGLAMMGIRRAPVAHPTLKGFESVFIGMLPQPITWGVTDGHLVLASNPNAVVTCLKVAAGTHPGIRKNKRVLAEALLPKGAFASVSYTDQRQLGQQISQRLGIASLILGFGAMGSNDPKVRLLINQVTNILTKLTPVATKIDFFKSTSAVMTFDGSAWRTRKVTRYFSPQEHAKRRAAMSRPADGPPAD